MRALFLLFFLGLGSSLFAQEYGFIQYNIEDGMPHSQVRSLTQDQHGFLWVGTLGGLARFDGENFLTYTTADGLSGNQIASVFQRSNGHLLVGMLGAYGTLTPQGFKMQSLPSPWNEEMITAFYEDTTYLWIGTENGLLQVAKDGQLNHSFEGKNIKAILNNSSGLIVATKDGLYTKQKESWTPVELPMTKVNIMDAFARNNSVYLATSGDGLLILKDGNTEQLTTNNGLPSDRINGVYPSADGVWLRSQNGFAKVSDAGLIHAYTEREGMPIADVRSILEDASGQVWLGTNGGGLLKFTGNRFATFTERSGLSSSLVMTGCVDQTGQIWLGTFDKGAVVMDNNKVLASYQFPEHLPNDKVWTSLCTLDSAVWLGTSQGLVRHKNGRFETFTEKDGLPHDKVLSLHQTESGKLFVGTNKGLAIWEEGSQRFSLVKSVAKTKIRAVTSLEDTLWVATIEGLFELNENERSIQQSYLDQKSVNALTLDNKARLWIGTSSGLHLLEDGKVKPLLVDKAASAQVINFLLNDPQGGLWVGTNNGIYAATTLTNSEYNWLHFTPHDGIGSLETNLNAAFLGPDGNQWFGTAKGVVRHNKRLLYAPKKQNGTKLTKIKLNLEPTDWTAYDSILDPVTALPQKAFVPHHKNHFTFEFMNQSLPDPRQTEYQYMLEGLDNDWQPISRENTAVYSNLPFDAFTFKVRSRLAGGDWGPTAQFPLEVRPPFWRTWWFIALVSLALGFVVYRIFQVRRENLITSLENEKLQIKSRMLQLEQQTLNSSMNRHFIFNSLNSIQYYINRKDRLAANTYLSNFAKLIRKNLDSSQSNFTPLSAELERLQLYLNLEHMRFPDRFEYHIDVAPNVPMQEAKIPAMLLQPFLENSIWHGLLPKKEKGSIWLKISLLEEQQIEITIEDNGIGIDTSLATKTNQPEKHISKGMLITNNRIDLMQKLTSDQMSMEGPLELKDAEGLVKGTFVRLIIPLNLERDQEKALA